MIQINSKSTNIFHPLTLWRTELSLPVNVPSHQHLVRTSSLSPAAQQRSPSAAWSDPLRQYLLSPPGSSTFSLSLHQSCRHVVKTWTNHSFGAHLHNMSLTNGRLRVPQDGRYYLYSQVRARNAGVTVRKRRTWRTDYLFLPIKLLKDLRMFWNIFLLWCHKGHWKSLKPLWGFVWTVFGSAPECLVAKHEQQSDTLSTKLKLTAVQLAANTRLKVSLTSQWKPGGFPVLTASTPPSVLLDQVVVLCPPAGLFPLSVPGGRRRRSAQRQPSAGAVRLQEDLLPQSHTGESLTESPALTRSGSLSPFRIQKKQFGCGEHIMGWLWL